MKNTIIKLGENISTNNCIHVGKWRDKRPVAYIATQFESEMGILQNRRGQETD